MNAADAKDVCLTAQARNVGLTGAAVFVGTARRVIPARTADV